MTTIDTAAFAEELDRFDGAQDALSGAIDAYQDTQVPGLADVRDEAGLALAFAVLHAVNEARRNQSN